MYNRWTCGYKQVIEFAVVAQLVRALPCHGRGCRFKSGRPRKIKRHSFGYVLFISSAGRSKQTALLVPGLNRRSHPARREASPGRKFLGA